MTGFEATFVVYVEGQQHRPRSEHGGQVRVIGDGAEVVRRPFAITQIGVVVDAGEKTGISRDGIAKRDAGVQRADEDRLPTATRLGSELG